MLQYFYTMTESFKQIGERQAHWLRRGADGLCYSRILAAPILASYIIAKPDFKSTKLAATVSLLYGTDKLDGIMARHAANIIGQDTTRASAELDQKADKILTTALFGAVIIREYLNGNNNYAKMLAADIAIDGVRNIIVNNKRNNATEGVDVAAQEIGKQKQLLFVLGAVTATSLIPGADSGSELSPGQSIVTGMVNGATFLSILSGSKMVQSIDAQTAALRRS